MRGGRIPTRALASMVLPAPGGPVNRMLWWPAAAISSARLAVSCPQISTISTPDFSSFVSMLLAVSLDVGATTFSPLRCMTTSDNVVTPTTFAPSKRAACLAFSFGKIIVLKPCLSAVSAMARAPRIERSWPLRPSSPANSTLSAVVGNNWPLLTRIAIAIGRSK